ncbi:hypothetical protein [Kribbella sp. NPDC051620]
MRASVAQLLAVVVIGLLALTACGSSSGENACEASATPTMSEKELDEKC